MHYREKQEVIQHNHKVAIMLFNLAVISVMLVFNVETVRMPSQMVKLKVHLESQNVLVGYIPEVKVVDYDGNTLIIHGASFPTMVVPVFILLAHAPSDVYLAVNHVVKVVAEGEDCLH